MLNSGAETGGKGRKLRVLVIAEQANPEWTSVPLIGWSLFKALTKVTDAHLVTQIRNREALLRSGLIEGLDFTAIDNDKIAGPLHTISNILGGGKAWTTVSAFSALAYYAFEFQVWRQFHRRLRDGEFDVVHRITPVSPISQSIIAAKLAKIDVPFVIGPLNGGIPWPKHFRHRQYAENEWLSHIRSLHKLMPGYRSSRRYSSVILTGSRFTQADMPSWARSKSVYVPENAIDVERFNLPRTPNVAFPLRGVFIGRLVPYKGADILVEAAAPFLRDGLLKIDIVGEGPQRGLLESKIAALDLQDTVTLRGWIPHGEMGERLRQYDFLALPSIREFGGGVVVEAMALGVMPIVAEYGGPAELVDAETGIRVAFTDETSLIEGFRDALARVIKRPSILNEYGRAAQAKALKSLTWDAKARQILDIYSSVTKG